MTDEQPKLPPGPAFITALLTDYRQQKRSWYMYLFQMPLADIIVANNDLAFIDGLWEDWSPGFDASDDVPRAMLCTPRCSVRCVMPP